MTEITIQDTFEEFMESVMLSRSENTAKTYSNGIKIFRMFLEEKETDIEQPISTLSEKDVLEFSKFLKFYAVATENLYMNIVKNYFEFLASLKYLDCNMLHIKMIIAKRSRKAGVRLPQFPKEQIENVLTYAFSLSSHTTETENDRLINLRDAAFLITLADTGLRVHEACALKRGDVDLIQGKAIIIGKGNKQAVVRFSDRSTLAIRSYISARTIVDGQTSKMLSALPIFARHDRGAGKKVLPITTKTGRMIVTQRVVEALGADATGSITPHSFRHYFVTNVLQKTGNLKIAQEFARHTNITITQRYAHLANNELDNIYKDIFNEPSKDL